MATLTWPQGNTRTQQPFTLQDGLGVNVSPVDLTNQSSIIVKLAKQSYPQTSYTTLTGVPSVVNPATGGVFNFKFSAADVAVPGIYNMVITVNFTGGDVWTHPPFTFQIQETS